MQIEIFIPCFIDQISPQTGIHTVRLLEKMGCDVHYNKNQTCCGQPAFNSGFRKEAKGIAQKFLKDFSTGKPVVSPSGSCTGYVRNHYPTLFKDTPEQSACKQIKDKVFEFAEFTVANLPYEQLQFKSNKKVTYHDGCGALRECKIKSAPRTLLEQVDGLQLIEMKEAETCCGFGGTFAVKYESISTGMAYTKVHSAIDTGAEYIITSDYSCMLHMIAYIEKHKLPMKVMHLSDFLYESLVS